MSRERKSNFRAPAQRDCPDVLVVDEPVAHRGRIVTRATDVGKELYREHLERVTNKLAKKTSELLFSNSRLSALTDFNLQLASERDPRLLLEKVCYSARILIGARYAVLVVDERQNTDSLFCTTSGIELAESVLPPSLPRLDRGPLGRLYAQGGAWRVRCDRNGPPMDVFPAGYPAAHAYLAVPVSSLTHTYGWLCLADKLGADEFTIEDEHILAILAGQVGRIYENGDLYQEIQRHSAQLQAEMDERERATAKIQHLNRVYAVLSGINALIIRAPTQAELFTEACRLAVEQGHFQLAWIGRLNGGKDRITPVAWAGDSVLAQLLRDNASVSIEADALQAAAIDRREPWVCNDLEAESQLILHQAEMIARGFRSVVTLPLVIHDRTVGCVVLATDQRGSFDAAEMRLLIALAGHISFALDHIEKAERLNYLAYYDSLTGLANRALFLERLSQYVSVAKHNETQFAVVVRDPQRFETINETFGRNYGDALLKEVADRLVECAGDANTVARVGPGQFAAVIPFVGEAGVAARALEEQYQAWLGTPFQINGTELTLSARGGISVYPHDGSDAESLLKNAEAALKRANSTNDHTVFFTQEISDRIAERLSMETRLRRALDNDEFVLHYQPKVDLATRELEGVEALIRWQSPELGLMLPAKFIPLMEETGMIIDVGEWVFRQASLDRCSWLERELAAPRIAVNVSTVQLRRADFVSVVRSALEFAMRNARMFGGLRAGIDIEVTESLLVENAEANMEKLQSIRELGIGIAIDDFGTGYSSLGYLAKLPVDSLKIDRSFTSAMLEDASVMTLVSTIITLAHALNLKVVAEGVEFEEQAKILRLLRCDQMQGYLISKPLSYDEMTALLTRSKSPQSGFVFVESPSHISRNNVCKR
jgi:diguanylate cyclase (GGDEF)-like protein